MWGCPVCERVGDPIFIMWAATPPPRPICSGDSGRWRGERISLDGLPSYCPSTTSVMADDLPVEALARPGDWERDGCEGFAGFCFRERPGRLTLEPTAEVARVVRLSPSLSSPVRVLLPVELLE